MPTPTYIRGVPMYSKHASVLASGVIQKRERCQDCSQYVSACVCDVLTDNHPTIHHTEARHGT